VYADQQGGTPLFQETQPVTLDDRGRYSVVLGAAHADGIPPAIFAAGAQWLSTVFERPGEVEGARVRLTSVPYALRAAESDTLGGRPASDYQLVSGATGTAPTATGASESDVAGPTGTTNFLPKYVDTVNFGNSAMYDAGGAIGLGTTAPFDMFHVRFTNTGGNFTGLAVQNLGNTATSYSGMLFFDQNGALGQFQGFNNVTHEYRINNIARNGASQYDGSIRFMLGGISKFVVDQTNGVGVFAPMGVLAGPADSIGLFVSGAHTGVSVLNSTAGGVGVFGNATAGSGLGLFGSTTTGYAVAGIATDPLGWAGYFDGDLGVTGTLYKGAGAFRIDHPLDPANKYLSHSFVESPDMKNIYDGVVTLNENGEAIVTLPAWFEALNQDFRYQLTPMGAAFVPYIVEEIVDNHFKIAGGVSGKKVSWQVTGIRHDAYANANRIQVEELKSGDAAGTYLHPEVFGQNAAENSVTRTSDDEKSRSMEDLKGRLRSISQRPTKD
jgi:hypothetical protein